MESGSGMNTLLFSEEELQEVDIPHLRNVLDYLGIPYEKKNTKDKLIQLILIYQREHTEEGLSSNEPPRYSVRIQRIMDSMKGNSQ